MLPKSSVMEWSEYEEYIANAPDHKKNPLEWEAWFESKNPSVRRYRNWWRAESIRHNFPGYRYYVFIAVRPVENFTELEAYELRELSRLIKSAKAEDWFKFENATRRKSIKRFHLNVTDVPYRSLFGADKPVCPACDYEL
jgi:hypothetical protein